MDTLAAMRAFVRAVELGSFSRAAAEAGIQVSTVSRHVAALEADLGAALLNRSTRGLRPTEIGLVFHASASRLLRELDEARDAAVALNARPQGLLRLNIPAAFGRRHVIPHLPAFLAAHPAITCEATLTDTVVDLIEAGADLAIRIGALPDSTLVARKLAAQRRMLVASPALLARLPPIGSPAALEASPCLGFTVSQAAEWLFREAGAARPLRVSVRGPLRANDSESLREAALAGLGLALLPDWLVGADLRAGRLTAVLPDWEAAVAPGPPPSIWAVYPPKKIVSPKVRAFIGFLAERLAAPGAGA